MQFKRILKNQWRLILLLLVSLFLLGLMILFLSARPWQLAKAYGALSDLEISFNRTSPCHEACLVKRLEYEALINPALKSNLPGLRERINEQLSDPKIKLAYKRELRRLLSN